MKNKIVTQKSRSSVALISVCFYLLGLLIILFACLIAGTSLPGKLDHPFIHLRVIMQLSSVYRCQENVLASSLTLFLLIALYYIL